MGNLVAIVGRPNVGKSTLFNRLTETRKAIVDESSGVTRDRHYGKAEWIGKVFPVVDTGGYVTGSDDVFEEEIRKQVVIGIQEAETILLMVDVTVGITDLDIEVAALLRKSKKNVIVVVNKVDNNQRIAEAGVFYKFGLGEPFCISSINGSGTGELLDAVIASFKEIVEEEDLGIPKFAIVGQPNVGKSSFLNALIGEERTIVTPIAGTTRDTIHKRYNAFGFDFFLIDTAGLRKKTKVHEDIEFYSVMRSIKAIEEADVCLLLIDATQGLTSQDISIFHLAEKNKKGIVVMVNKWDLIEKGSATTKVFEEAIREKLSPFKDVPIVFTSVTTKQRIHKALETAVKVYNSRMLKIATSQLNKIMLPIIEHYSPPALKGKVIKINYITQLPTPTPSFAFFCNLPQYIKEPYRRYLENKMRENFDFEGVPIALYFRAKH
jgi:GTP-binding protein